MTDHPPLFDRELVKSRVLGFLDAPDADAAECLVPGVVDLVVSEITYLAVAGRFAIVLGNAFRATAPPGVDSFFGVDPRRAEGADPAEVQLNRVIAAAANHDGPMMRDLLSAIVRGPEETSAKILGQLACHARQVYQASESREALL